MKYPYSWLGSLKGILVWLGQRLRGAIAGLPSRLVPEEGWVTFVLLALVVLSVVWTVETSRWVSTMPSLPTIVLIALLVGLIMAKIRLPGLLLHPIALSLGLVVVAWQTCLILPGEGWQERFFEFTDRLSAWINVVRMGGISSDPLPFGVQLGCLAWLVAYVSAWFVFHSRRVWGGVIPSGLAILVNLSYLPGRYGAFFALYLLAAMLLVMRLNLVKQEREWRESHINYPRFMGLSFLGNVLVLGIVLLILVWQFPLLARASPLVEAWERAGEPWERFEVEFNRLYSALTSRKPTPLHAFGDTLPFRGAISLGSNVVFTVSSDRPGYWRASTYDIYTGQGWLSSERVSQPLGWKPAQVEPQGYFGRGEVTQTVKLGFATNILFASGVPLRASLDARQEMARPAIFIISLEDDSKDAGLPADIRSLAEHLRQVIGEEDRVIPDSELFDYLPKDIKGVDVERLGLKITSLRVERVLPNPVDITALRSSERLVRSEQYTIESSISVASVDELRAAGTDYPGWVVDRYLQLPPELPSRVRRLSEVLTSSYDNAYDKATAIEAFLRGMVYSTDIYAPPYGSDGVDYFLFTSRAGYCDYYASAMAVMLRSVGIPSRVATGYARGDYDAEKEVYVVRELHAHTWPEVFFPGYGWVEWEPTTALPLIERAASSPSETISGELLRGEEVEELLEPEFPVEEGGYAATVPSGSSWLRIRWQFGFLLTPLLFLPVVWFFWRRGLSQLGYAAQAYGKMCRLASLAGLGPKPYQTPREYARQLSSALPQEARDTVQIAESYVKAEYGKKAIEEGERQGIEDAWRQLRGELLLRILRWKRS